MPRPDLPAYETERAESPAVQGKPLAYAGDLSRTLPEDVYLGFMTSGRGIPCSLLD